MAMERKPGHGRCGTNDFIEQRRRLPVNGRSDSGDPERGGSAEVDLWETLRSRSAHTSSVTQG